MLTYAQKLQRYKLIKEIADKLEVKRKLTIRRELEGKLC